MWDLPTMYYGLLKLIPLHENFRFLNSVIVSCLNTIVLIHIPWFLVVDPILCWNYLSLPGLGFFENLIAFFLWGGVGWGASRLAGKKHAVFQKVFVHFTWNFVHILYWQYGISLDKKIEMCHFCHHLMTSSWKSCVDIFLSFLVIDVFLLVDSVCKIHIKKVVEDNSKKVIILLQYKKIFQKQKNHFNHCIKIYKIFNFTRITFAKKWRRQQ